MRRIARLAQLLLSITLTAVSAAIADAQIVFTAPATLTTDIRTGGDMFLMGRVPTDSWQFLTGQPTLAADSPLNVAGTADFSPASGNTYVLYTATRPCTVSDTTVAKTTASFDGAFSSSVQHTFQALYYYQLDTFLTTAAGSLVTGSEIKTVASSNGFITLPPIGDIPFVPGGSTTPPLRSTPPVSVSFAFSLTAGDYLLQQSAIIWITSSDTAGVTHVQLANTGNVAAAVPEPAAGVFLVVGMVLIPVMIIGRSRVLQRPSRL